MTFDTRMDPDLAPGLDVYRALGFEEGSLSGEGLATVRAKFDEFMEMAQGMIPPNDRVTSEDREVPGPDGNQIPVRIYRPVADTGTLPCL